MHPNAFLSTLWRAEVLDTVFVAMSFDPRFDKRFSEIIKPAIEAVPIGGHRLSAYRVDVSKTGDSILTEIISGVAHARLVLADVSVIDEGRYTQVPIRNANVMYELGIALACRTPSEVLIVRDDTKPLLFDLSTIPTLSLDFEATTAVEQLRAALSDRLRETEYIRDARVLQAARSLTQYELSVLKVLEAVPSGRAGDLSMKGKGSPSLMTERGLSGLLARGFARAVGVNSESGAIFYALTPLGRALAKAAATHLARLKPSVETLPKSASGESAA